MATVGVHAVTVGGVDISCLVDTVAINHGRDEPGAQPEASSVSVDFTTDPDNPLPAAVEIGATMVVTTTTVGHAASARFTGKLTDLLLGWDDEGADTPDAGVGQMVAVGVLADLGRRVVGDAPFPQELDGARVSRVMSLAGITLDPGTSDPGTVQILPRDIDSQPALSVAQGAAASASGVVWEARTGDVRYADALHRRNIPSALTLDACDILVTPSWRRTLEGLVNQVSIGYGALPAEGEQPRYVAESTPSVGKFGRFNYSTTTELAALADAQAFGDLLLARNSTPVWVMASLPVDIKGLDDARYNALLGLDMHSLLTLTGLPAIGAAPTSAVLWVEGWHETLSWDSHEIELVVSGYCRTVPAPRWDDVDPSWLWGGGLVLAERRRNTARNPKLGVDATDWATALGTGGAATSARTTGAGLVLPTGQTVDTFYRSTWTTVPTSVASAGQVVGAPTGNALPLVGGQPITISGYHRDSHAGRNTYLVITFHDAAGAQVATVQGPIVATGGATWRRLAVTYTPPASAVRAYVRFYCPGADANWVVGDTMDSTAVLCEATTDTSRLYFDGSTPDTATEDYGWTGPADGSASTMVSAWTETRRNRAGNPIGPVTAITGWWTPSRATAAINGDALRFTITDANPAATAQRINGPFPPAATAVVCTPGQRYTLSCDMRTNSAAGGGISIGFYDAAGVAIGAIVTGPNTPLNPNTFTRFSFTQTAPAGAAFLYPGICLHTGGRNIGEWFDVRRILIEESPTAGTYFDGDTADPSAIEDYRWTGTPNVSPSIRATAVASPGGLPSDLTWDQAACLGPPAYLGRWDDQPATLRWDQVPPTTVWDQFT